MKKSILLALMFLILTACSAPKPVKTVKRPVPVRAPREVPVEVKEEPAPVLREVYEEEVIPPVQLVKKAPFVMREFRAAWVATVANINWPSKAGLSTQEQQREAIALLDFLKKHNYNAVIFQVRPQADALYVSDLEPWSVYLTGVQGQAPQPFYDPLQFWIDAAHERGLELHVWLNPYRAHHSTGGEITGTSVVKKRPELVVKLKNGMWWMDPSKEETQDHTAAVVMDIVKRYNIDGVHFDDYFYPYASYNKGEDFPDAASYTAYRNNGGQLERGDWRRDGVNRFVERIYKEIKAEKPAVKFGISPFGIYRPGFPKSAKGMDQYNELYADARLWLNEGWVDYYSPQLYWKISQPGQSFPLLLGWWDKENHKNRHLWPGIQTDFGGDDLNTIETISQIMITRGMLPRSMGTLHWSIGPLLKYPTLAGGLLEGPYSQQALVPESPWLDPVLPPAPKLQTAEVNGKVQVNWKPGDGEETFKYVLYYRYGDRWDYKILNSGERSFEFSRSLAGKGDDKLTHVGITAVDRTGNQSEFVEIELQAASTREQY